MQAVILAGGQGTRLRPVTCKRPKPMVPVVNRPILEHTVELLARHGIEDIIITLCYRPEVIRDYFQDGDEWGVNISYTMEDTPLGTAGAVRLAFEKYDLEDSFFVVSGEPL